jgi:hypothetical protein
VACVGCSGVSPQTLKSVGSLGARITLKSPIDQKCQEAGLKECAEVTEGLLLHLENKAGEGKEHLRLAASANSPEALRNFAKVLVGIGSIPGAADYMGPLLEAAKFLDAADGPATPDVRTASYTESTTSQPEVATAVPSPQADEEARLTASMVTPLQNGSAVRCSAGGINATCVRVASGPIIFTGLSMVGHCNDRALALVANAQGDRGAAQWAVSVIPAQPNFSGGRYLVPAGTSLFVGLESPPSSKTSPQCALAWSGLRSSGVRSAEPAKLVAEAAPPSSGGTSLVSAGAAEAANAGRARADSIKQPAVPAAWVAKLDAADAFVRDEKYDSAIQLYRAILTETQPGAVPRAFRGLGVAYYRNGDTALAAEAFKRYLPWASTEESRTLQEIIRAETQAPAK